MPKPRIVNKRHLHLKHRRLFPATGDRLWFYRQSLGATQRGLAEDCDLSAGVIGRLERGYTLGMTNTMVKIARSLGISVDWLLDFSEDKEVQNPVIKKKWQRIA